MKFEYDLFYSARKTVSVSISPLNKITVRCPWGMHRETVESFLDSKQDWIERTLRANARRLAEHEKIVSGEKALICGKPYPVIPWSKNAIADGKIYIKDKKALLPLIVKGCGNEFFERVNAFAREIKVVPASLKFKNYKGRWGVCDGNGNIVFDCKVLMLPENLQNYIAVHELCHILHCDHSTRFWNAVQRHFPDYKAAVRELKDYAFLISLY